MLIASTSASTFSFRVCVPNIDLYSDAAKAIGPEQLLAQMFATQHAQEGTFQGFAASCFYS